MIKHGIAPNPCNFTLWFVYVTNRDQELKKALDQIIQEKKEFSGEDCRNLFKKYVMKEEIDLQAGLQDSLTSVLHELKGSLEKTKIGANNFQHSMEESLECISGNLSSASIQNIIKLLIQTTQSIKSVTNDFQGQLINAENEVTKLRKLLHEEERRTYIDPLTQIGNRRAFDKHLTELFQNKKRNVSLVLIDLDHFKKLNDTYGHLIGDKVLQGIGQILQTTCPDNALVARYGGEEFVMLMEDSQEAACRIAESIRASLHKLTLKKKSTGEIVSNITASFGIAQKVDGEYPDQLIERADNALYTAKTNGRDRICQSACKTYQNSG
ncbi:MAG: GGDEF domain-containing protein [Burkholderiales bacterium]|nr:GGDEF domain-containing protein [Burkholderiales bacterium]